MEGRFRAAKDVALVAANWSQFPRSRLGSIAELVESFPEPRRSQVKARFEDAKKRLEDAGLLEKLREPERWYREGFREFGLEYFRQRIPCPFLEDEACSIYPDRPLTCREFLVTTPAEYRQDPGTKPIRSVKLPMSVGPALAKSGIREDESPAPRWVALVLALEWDATNPDTALVAMVLTS